MASQATTLAVLALLASANAFFSVPGVGKLPGAGIMSGAIDTATDVASSFLPVPEVGKLPGADIISRAIDTATDVASSFLPVPGVGNLPGAEILSDATRAATDVASSVISEVGNLPGAEILSDATRAATDVASSVISEIPGVSDMTSLATGGIETILKLLIKSIDISMITRAIQRVSEIVRAVWSSGLRLLDLKIEDVFGIKGFTEGLQEYAEEAEVPQYITDAVLAYTAVVSQSLLSV